MASVPSEIVEEAVHKFQQQRSIAKMRKIEFKFTFSGWWDWWAIDNNWAKRGQGKESLVMARFNDTGPYAIDNVYCCTHRQNGLDQKRNHSITEASTKSYLGDAWKNAMKNLWDDPNWTPKNSRAIMTPDGQCKSIMHAARVYGKSATYIMNRLKQNDEGWFFI